MLDGNFMVVEILRDDLIKVEVCGKMLELGPYDCKNWEQARELLDCNDGHINHLIESLVVRDPDAEHGIRLKYKAGDKIRAYTWNQYHYISLVLPNLVVFQKEKATGEWKRRQHIDRWLDEDRNWQEERCDSLWGSKEFPGICQDEMMKELPEDEVVALWNECMEALGIGHIDEIKRTERTF